MACRWKGELGDGHVHMTAREYVEHKVQENIEENKMILKKLANNPILTEEVRKAVRFALYRLDDIVWLRKVIDDKNEEIENIKSRYIVITKVERSK